MDTHIHMNAGGWVAHQRLSMGGSPQPSWRWVDTSETTHRDHSEPRCKHLFKSPYPVYQHNLWLLVQKGTETPHGACERCSSFIRVWACMCGPAKAGVPDCGERIRSLECKTLLDPSATFGAKIPCPYLSLMGHDPIGSPFRMLTSFAPHHSVCLKPLHSLTVGPKLACLG